MASDCQMLVLPPNKKLGLEILLDFNMQTSKWFTHLKEIIGTTIKEYMVHYINCMKLCKNKQARHSRICLVSITVVCRLISSVFLLCRNRKLTGSLQIRVLQLVINLCLKKWITTLRGPQICIQFLITSINRCHNGFILGKKTCYENTYL